VGGWNNIIQISAGYDHTVGLKSDGTVVAVGDNVYGQCNVSSWTNIVQVSAGGDHTVGLKQDGSVVAVGAPNGGRCDVGGWNNIIQISAGSDHTVGLKSDGTVVAVGSNSYGQSNVGGLGIVTQVSAGTVWTAGLKSNGTVVTNGTDVYGQMDVGSWTNIAYMKAAHRHSIGLKSDLTVVAVGNNNYGQCNVGSWNNIIQVSGGDGHTVGLKSDGTVVAKGLNDYGECNVGDWNLGVGVFPLVPNVLLMLTEAQAENILTSAGYFVSVIYSYSPDWPSGIVYYQSPLAGTYSPFGSRVVITVSCNSPTSVPNVAGMSQANAENAITSAGLIVGSINQAYSLTVPAGNVINQSPGAGTSACSDNPTSVSLTISLGPISVPNVVGMRQGSGESAITIAGLTMGTISQAYNLSIPLGRIISESPPAGTNVLPGTPVSLTISLGRVCPCDINHDSRCDMHDWLLFGKGWGRTNCQYQIATCECDLNDDGRCDMRDWLFFGKDWGRTNCPMP